MSEWFLYFFLYSLAGCCLEKLFAWAVRAERQVRKCFLLLPICPVYGLAMCLVAAIVPAEAGFLRQAVEGGVLCTVVEYLVHLFYDKVFGVQFWDYHGMRGHIRGRVCPVFTLAWGVLSAAALRWVHPYATALAGALAPEVAYLAWVFLAADCMCTGSLLLRYHDTGMLTAGSVFAAARRRSSQSHIS